MYLIARPESWEILGQPIERMLPAR